jgi:hypothetical protein
MVPTAGSIALRTVRKDVTIHSLMGYTMAVVAGLHATLQLGTMRTFIRKRLKVLAGESPQHGSSVNQARGAVDQATRRFLVEEKPIHQRTTR